MCIRDRAWSTDATLAAAVSNGGAAGIIGTGGRPTEWVEEEIKKAKTLTDRPFGINLMLMAPNVEEIAELALREKVAFVTTGAGSPLPWIERMHQLSLIHIFQRFQLMFQDVSKTITDVVKEVAE